MNTNSNLFIVLYLYYYLLLNSFISLEAITLASNPQTFTIDLIRRSHNPPSATRTTQQRPTLGSISSNHHFNLSSKHYGHGPRAIGTEVMPNGGDYLMKIAIGTPPVELTAVADTGSDLIWVQCSPCQQCIPQEEPLFNPGKSSSYKTMACDFKNCNYTALQSTCIPSNGRSLCVYKAGYGDGTGSIGVLATEKLAFMSGFGSEIKLGCGFKQQGDFGTHGDGIVGLGTGSLSLVSQLGPAIHHKFTYCLTPLTSKANGKLKLGPNKMGLGSVSTPMVNLDPESTFYELTLDSVRIGTTSVKVGQDVIIDSGTTLTYLESSVYDSIKTAMVRAIRLEPVPDPDQVLEPCYRTEDMVNDCYVPEVVFRFRGADVVLKGRNTFTEWGNLSCLAIVPTDEGFIFGNVGQVNFEVEYDLVNKQVSFAPADCTKY